MPVTIMKSSINLQDEQNQNDINNKINQCHVISFGNNQNNGTFSHRIADDAINAIDDVLNKVKPIPVELNVYHIFICVDVSQFVFYVF